MSILVSERSKPQHEKLSWTEMSIILNAEGPSIKTASQWSVVNMEQSYCNLQIFSLLFFNSGSVNIKLI